MSIERKKVIELQGVGVRVGMRSGVSLSGVSLCLESGEAAILSVPETGLSSPLADVCCGLEDSEEGTVRFLDRLWSERNAEQMNRARGRIGRVWAGSAWVGNLDMDENIVLPQLHHTNRPYAELREQAEGMARSFGLDGLPHTRPAWTPPDVRQKAQWVRALMGVPDLLLLEFPESNVEDADCTGLAAAVDERRARGGAVLWITSDPVPALTPLHGTVRQAEVTGGTLVWRTPIQKRSNPQKG